MAEQTILVCDQCGRPAAETVTIRVARGNFVKDLCAMHVSELIGGARKPRRGRPRSAAKPIAARASAGRKKPASTKASSKRKKPAAKRGAKRRTRSPASPS